MKELPVDKNKEEFTQLLLSTNRMGAERMIEWLNHTDFFSAPASTQFHLACKGGLCQHSLNVYKAAMSIKNNMSSLCIPEKDISKIPDESIIIAALLHDICKADFYVPNIKWYKEEGATRWQKYMGYDVNDVLPLGHGEKSALIAQQFISLNCSEILAIRWHMGFSEVGTLLSPYEKPAMMKSLEIEPLVVLLQNADMFSTYYMEAVSDIKKDNALR